MPQLLRTATEIGGHQAEHRKPGRRYFGICAPGKSRPATLIRVYVAFLTAAQNLVLGAKARAALDGRPTPSLEDIEAVALLSRG